MIHSTTSTTLKDAIQYFKGETGYDRLFLSFLKKYKSIGKVGGYAVIQYPTEKEKKAIGGFLAKDIRKEEKISISLIKFELRMQETKFKGIMLTELLEGYFGFHILSNKEKKEKQKNDYNLFVDSIERDLQSKGHWNKGVQLFIEELKQNKNFPLVSKIYKENQTKCKQIILDVSKAIWMFPNVYIKLPIFAAKVTGNPHAFDLGTERNKLLIQFIQFQQLRNMNQEVQGMETIEEQRINYHPNAEEITEILSVVKIMRDDLLNDVTCIGLRGWINEHVVDPILEVSYQYPMIVKIPLKNMVKINKVESKKKRVFVFENSSLFSTLVDELIEENVEIPSMICTNGQFKLASLILMDLLTKSGATIYYAGDFDPEGLQMIERLMKRYPNQVELFLYGEKEYIEIISNEEISSESLSKLNTIKSPLLQEVKERMKYLKKPAYQELLLGRYVQELKK